MKIKENQNHEKRNLLMITRILKQIVQNYNLIKDYIKNILSKENSNIVNKNNNNNNENENLNSTK